MCRWMSTKCSLPLTVWPEVLTICALTVSLTSLVRKMSIGFATAFRALKIGRYSPYMVPPYVPPTTCCTPSNTTVGIPLTPYRELRVL